MTNLAPHATFDLFDNLLHNLMRPSTASAARVARVVYPRVIAVDVIDTADKYRILADVPGLKKEDIELTVDGSRVTLAATTKSDSEQPQSSVKVLAAERYQGQWRRTIELPEEIDDETVSATLKDGVLELSLAKKTPRGIRRVEIA